MGIGLSDCPVGTDLDGVQHHVLAMQRALADSGVAKSDIDGYVSAGAGGLMVDDAVTMAEYLRIDHRYVDGTMTGGSSFEFHVQHVAAAIREGLCDTALITYGSDQLTRMGRRLGTGGFQRAGQAVAGPMQYEAPYGNSLVGSYAMHACATCTSSARRPSSSRRSPSASVSSRGSTPTPSIATPSPSTTSSTAG